MSWTCKCKANTESLNKQNGQPFPVMVKMKNLCRSIKKGLRFMEYYVNSAFLVNKIKIFFINQFLPRDNYNIS